MYSALNISNICFKAFPILPICFKSPITSIIFKIINFLCLIFLKTKIISDFSFLIE